MNTVMARMLISKIFLNNSIFKNISLLPIAFIASMLAICIGISRYAIQKMRMNGTENIHFSVSNTFTNGVATENNPISRGNITKLLVFILLLTIFLILFLSSCLNEKTGKSTVCIEVLMLSIINAGNCLPLSKYPNMDGV